jgi:hypothetical protein
MPLNAPARPQELKIFISMTSATFASHLVMAGVVLLTVKELLGHKQINMTVRYSHLAPEHTALAVAKLTDRFKPSEAVQLAKTGTASDQVEPANGSVFSPKLEQNRNIFLVRRGRGLGLFNDNNSSLEAASGFEPLHRGFADLSLNHLGTPP